MEVAQTSEVVSTMVPDTAAVEDALFRDLGVAAGVEAGLDPVRVGEACSAALHPPESSRYTAGMIDRAFEPGARIELHQKDLHLALMESGARGCGDADDLHLPGPDECLHRRGWGRSAPFLVSPRLRAVGQTRTRYWLVGQAGAGLGGISPGASAVSTLESRYSPRDYVGGSLQGVTHLSPRVSTANKHGGGVT